MSKSGDRKAVPINTPTAVYIVSDDRVITPTPNKDTAQNVLTESWVL